MGLPDHRQSSSCLSTNQCLLKHQLRCNYSLSQYIPIRLRVLPHRTSIIKSQPPDSALLNHFLTSMNSPCSWAACTQCTQATAPKERFAVRRTPPANSALDLDLFPSALHSQVSRRALFAPALPFPIRRMQTIEKRRYLGCVFCILMYPLRFSSERKRVCMADGNDSVRCKTARRLTVRSSAPLPPASSPRSFRYPPCK